MIKKGQKMTQHVIYWPLFLIKRPLFFDQQMSFWRDRKSKKREKKKHPSLFFRLCVTSSEEEGLDDQAAGDDLDRTRAEVFRG